MAFAVKFTNFKYFVFCQLGLVVLFATGLPLLLNHVGIVVLSRTWPNVVRIDTGAIVAGMASHLAFWERLVVVDFPRDAACNTTPAAVMNRTITTAMYWPLPNPTIGEEAGNTEPPKIILQGVIPRSLQTMHRTETEKIALAVLLGGGYMSVRYICGLPATTLTDAIGREQAIFGNPSGIVLKIVGKVGRWGRILHGIRTSIAATERVVGTLARRFHYFLFAIYHPIIAHMCHTPKLLFSCGGPG